MPRIRALAVVTAVAALTLAGCADDAAPPAPAPAPAPPAPGTILSASSTKQLGTIVVDGDTNTLYRFDKDSADPSKSTCVDTCATNWPPMLTDPAEKPVLEGIDESAVGTVPRPDGTIQVTIGGWPVYRHAADRNPGATDGNGVDGTWFAVSPDGSKATLPDEN